MIRNQTSPAWAGSPSSGGMGSGAQFFEERLQASLQAGIERLAVDSTEIAVSKAPGSTPKSSRAEVYEQLVDTPSLWKPFQSDCAVGARCNIGRSVRSGQRCQEFAGSLQCRPGDGSGIEAVPISLRILFESLQRIGPARLD